MKPFEDHPPLSIDPDRVKVLQVALELLQPVLSNLVIRA